MRRQNDEMNTSQGLAVLALASAFVLSGCGTTTSYDEPIASEPGDPDLLHWSNVAQNQLGECLSDIGTVDYFDWVPFDDDPTAYGALYVYFKSGEYGSVTLLAREWANGDEFVAPWTDKDQEILETVNCFD